APPWGWSSLTGENRRAKREPPRSFRRASPTGLEVGQNATHSARGGRYGPIATAPPNSPRPGVGPATGRLYHVEEASDDERRIVRARLFRPGPSSTLDHRAAVIRLACPRPRSAASEVLRHTRAGPQRSSLNSGWVGADRADRRLVGVKPTLQEALVGSSHLRRADRGCAAGRRAAVSGSRPSGRVRRRCPARRGTRPSRP